MIPGATTSRSTWKQVGVWSLSLALFSLLVWSSLPKGPTEPQWKGRTLSQWLDTPAFAGFYEYRPVEKAENKEAFDAVRAMGTNCLPWLLARLAPREKPGRFREWLDELALKVEESGGQVPWERSANQHTRQVSRAIAAFFVLGQVAAPAVPQLRDGLLGRDGHLERLASANALGVLGDSGVSVLLNAVTSTDARARQYAVCGLGPSTTNCEMSLAALCKAAADSERRVRQFASLSLAQFTNHSSIVVPALTNLMADSDKLVRHSAMFSLKMYKGDLTAAIPALELAVSDPDTRMSNHAKETLEKLRSQSIKTPP